MTKAARLAVDIGGTFTDLVLELPERTLSAKVLTTPDAPERAVLEGTSAILSQAGITAADLALVIHGTTLATNALIERKGARTALVTTDGFRDSLEMAYEHRFEQYDLYMERPEPLVARPWRFEVPERIAADGTVLLAMDEAAVERIGVAAKAEGAEAIAVCFLHSYQNDVHEQRARDILSRYFTPDVIAISSEVCPEIREYERTSTTVANAYVLPLMERYLRQLEAGLKTLGSDAPLLLIMSSGGITTVETARRFPIRLVESGPAGGAILAQMIAAQNGIARALSFDMGGTTAKITLIDDMKPQQARHFEIARAARFVKGSGIPVRIPVIDMVEIGAGGGSIARVDGLGRITVGPDSAGSMPGPACYGRGGTLPTVTDANVVLGYLPEDLLGGSFKLDREGAKAAVQTIADALGVTLMEAARGIIDIVNENMFGALRMISVQQGYDPRDFAVMGFGGAGPLHVNAVAKLMGSWPAISPVSPGVLCALGDATTRMRTETARSWSRLAQDTKPEDLVAVLAEMAEQVTGELLSDGVPADEITTAFEVDVRYAGQAFEVPLTISADLLAAEGIAGILGRFDEEHKRLFTFNMDTPHEIVNLRAVALGRALDLPAAPIEKGNGDPAAAKLRDHMLWMDGREQAAVIYDRAKLKAGDILPGPAIVCEMDSTTLIESGCVATVDPVGNILINLA